MKKNQWKSGIAYSLLFVFIAIVSLTPSGMDKSIITWLLVLAAICTISYLIYDNKYELSRNWASMTVLFILGYCIVHLQMPLLYVIGFNLADGYNWFYWADEKIVNKAVGLSIFGLLSFYIGKLTANTDSQSNTKKESTSIFFLLVVVYVSYVGFFLTSGSYSSGAYAAGDAGSYAKYLYLIFNSALLSAVIIRLYYVSSINSRKVSLRKYVSYFGAPLLFILTWHVVFSFYVGDRGPVITYCLLCSSLYFYRFNQVGVLRFVTYIVIASLLFTLMGSVRTKNSGESYSQRVLSAVDSRQTNNKFNDIDIPGSSLLDLAYSGRATNHALANVPEKYPYTLGYYQLFNITAIVPGLSGIFWQLFGNAEDKYNSSSGFISYLIQGDNTTYGDGTTVVADLYLDFGSYGVIFGLFVFGIFMAKFERQLYQGQPNSILLWIAALMYLSVSIYIGRSSIAIQFQKIILVYLLIKVNSFVSFHYAKKS